MEQRAPPGGVGGAPASASAPPPRDTTTRGWLTQSTVPPRKRKEIEGVSASSLVALQAQLYRRQEAAERARSGGDDGGPDAGRERRRAGLDVSSTGRHNAGVAERDKRCARAPPPALLLAAVCRRSLCTEPHLACLARLLLRRAGTV